MIHGIVVIPKAQSEITRFNFPWPVPDFRIGSSANLSRSRSGKVGNAIGVSHRDGVMDCAGCSSE